MISVLHFSNGSVRGGVEEHVLTLLRGLDRRHFRVGYVCPPALAAGIKSELAADIEVIPLRFDQRLEAPGAAVRLARILRRWRPDILHAHMFQASVVSAPVGWLCRVPVILETPHVRERWRRGPLKGNYAIDRAISRFVDYHIAVSKANARYLAEEKRLQPGKIVVIRNGCDVRRFDPSLRPCPKLKRSLGFSPDDPVLVAIGRLEPQKGHGVLLDALAQVRLRFRRVRLVCVGEGGLRAQLETRAAALGIADAVRFVGFQTDVAEWLRLADVTVLPSLYEGLPLAAIESLAAGRALVATAADGTAEVVIDRQTGLLVPPGRKSELAEAIGLLLDNPELRQKVARAGRTWVEQYFTHDRQISETASLYLSALRATRRGGSYRPAGPAANTPDALHT